MIAANKKRIQVTVEVDTLDQARSNAQKLGMSLSGYVNTVLKAVGTENMQDAFDVVLSEVVQAVARQKRDEGKAV
jgi:antitoxin component of RelBE/YafQ-DinJ toxin-antitoxin module